MLSIKRILGLILIVLFSVPFALWESITATQTVSNLESSPVVEEIELIVNQKIDKTQGYEFLVVGKDEVITKNILSLLKQQKLNCSKVEYANWKDFTDKDMVIICDNEISNMVDLKHLESYISKGGNVLFAGGLSEYFTDSFLNPILGIEQKTISIETGELEIADGFFVIDAQTMNYNDFNSSIWLSLRKSAEVYIRDKKTSLPIVFSNEYNKGKALVINASMLDNPHNMGIVTALISKGLETFAYPILGKSLTFLDSISDIAYNDELTIAEYGVNSSSLLLDKLMPELIALSLQHNIAYTASLQVVSSTVQSVLRNDLSTTWSIAKELLKYNGEITFSGNFEEDNYKLHNNILDDFNIVFPNYTPNAFMINSGKHTVEIDNYILYSFPQTSVIRYIDSIDTTMVKTSIPSFSYGLDLDGGEKWKIINNLTSTGLFSHRMDIRKLAGFSDDDISYQDTLKQLYKLSLLYKQISWLQPVTISQAIPSIKSYNSLEFSQQKTSNGYIINVDNFIDTQNFMLYSENEIADITGATAQAIGGNYYMIKCNQSRISITWEKE